MPESRSDLALRAALRTQDMSPYHMKTTLQSRSSSYVALIDGEPTTGWGTRGRPQSPMPQGTSAESVWAHPILSGLSSSSKHLLVQVCTETNVWWVRLVFKAGVSSSLPYSKDLASN